MICNYLCLSMRRGKFPWVVVSLMALAGGAGYYAGQKTDIYSLVNSVRNFGNEKENSVNVLAPQFSLLNISNFYFLHNPNKTCSQRFLTKAGYKTIISVVHSDRKNFKARAMVRNTHGSIGIYQGWYVQVVFAIGLGLPGESKTVGDLLEEEATEYGDIILGNFIDTYRNLSYKHLAGYKWATEFCPQAKFYVKSDDDVLVNIFHVIEFLSDKTTDTMDKTFYCRPAIRGSPIRDPVHKYDVPKEEYPKDIYPDYCTFGVYVTGIGTARKILAVSTEVPFLRMEDAFVTGVLRERVNEKETVPANTIKIVKGFAFYHGRGGIYTVDELEKKTRLGVINEERSSALSCSLWSLILEVHEIIEMYPSNCNSLVPTEFA